MTLIILPAKMIHICSAQPECFTACLCQCSPSTSCFIIDIIGCKWAFIQATWRNSQSLLCSVIIGKGFPFQHTSEPHILVWKDLTIAIKTQRLKRIEGRRGVFNNAPNNCYWWLTSLDSNEWPLIYADLFTCCLLWLSERISCIRYPWDVKCALTVSIA